MGRRFLNPRRVAVERGIRDEGVLVAAGQLSL